jgi:acyl-CoA thioesterase-1
MFTGAEFTRTGVGKKVRRGWRSPYGRRRLLVHLAGIIALAAGPAAAAPVPEAGPGQDVHILALGDSLTAGFGLPRRQGFVPQLEAYLRRQGIRARIVNAGVSGDTAAQGRRRLAWTLNGLPQQPQLAIVALGANDMLRGLPPAQTRQELDAIVADLKGRGVKLLLSGMIAAPNLGPDYAAAFNAIYPDLARKHGATLQPFFLQGVAGDRALNQADGIHPGFAGVKRMVIGIAPKVAEALGG